MFLDALGAEEKTRAKAKAFCLTVIRFELSVMSLRANGGSSG
jgi:hypothetical protein